MFKINRQIQHIDRLGVHVDKIITRVSETSCLAVCIMAVGCIK